jgi:heptosyltransferase III
MSYQRILIYHIGSLGDTLVALPAFRAVRGNFPDARITLLTDFQRGKNRVQCHDILEGSGLVDDHILYTYDDSLFGRATRSVRMMALLFSLRGRKFDALVYLLPTSAHNPRLGRDKLYFRLSGIKRIIGMSGFIVEQQEKLGHPAPTVPHVSDQLLARLADSGLTIPSAQYGGRYLNISGAETANARMYLRQQGDDGSRTWIAIGPGSKMPAKVWPKDRFKELVRRLIETHDIWPVIFGGKEDASLGRELTTHWGMGYVAAGVLSVRESLAAMENCALYIGNDTGTLHMAASAGIPCVGIYSARDYPGLWYPYGKGHIVFRNAVPCEGCMKEVCIENKMMCILSIGIDEVFTAATRCIPRDTGHPGHQAVTQK